MAQEISLAGERTPPISVRENGVTGVSGGNPCVAPASPCDVRVPPSNGIVRVFRGLSQKISSILPGRARASNSARTRLQNLRVEFDARLTEAVDLFVKDGEDAQSIANSLIGAGRCAVDLQNDGVGLQNALGRFRSELQRMSPSKLHALVRAFQTTRMAEAQKQLQFLDKSEAERLLASTEQAAIAELVRRIDITVDDALLHAAQSDDPKHVRALMREAFKAATPLVRLGVLPVNGKAIDEVRKEITRAVLEGLARNTPEQRAKILRETSPQDLKRLHAFLNDARRSQSPLDEEVAMAIGNEYRWRPDRIAGSLFSRLDELQKNFSNTEVIQPQPDELIREISRIAELASALDENADNGIGDRWYRDSPQYQKAMGHIETLLGSYDERIGGVNALVLSTTLDQLGRPQAARRLRGAQGKSLVEQRTRAYKNSVQRLMTGVVADATTANLLRYLQEVSEASHHLDEAQRTINTQAPARPIAAARRRSFPVERMRECLTNLPEEVLRAVAPAFAAPRMAELREKLKTGIELAMSAEEAELSMRMQSMADQLEVAIAVAVSARPGAAPVKPFEAGKVEADVDSAMREAFGMDLSGRGNAALNGGTLGTPQFLSIMVENVERPLSNKERQMKILPSGRSVSEQFVNDALRRTSYRMPDGSEMIDYSDWGNLPQTECLKRIDQGYQRLISEVCNGDEKGARNLTMYAHQGVVAGFRVACGITHPFQLPDGHCGFVDVDGFAADSRLRSYQTTALHFDHGENGLPQIVVDYGISGGMLHAFDETTGLAEDVWLAADSRIHGRFHVEINGERATLLSPPAYHYHLSASDFQKPYPPLTETNLRSAISNGECQANLRAYCQSLGREREAHALIAIESFRSNPTHANAVAVAAAYRGDASATSLLPSDIMQKLAGMASDTAPSKHFFDAFEGKLVEELAKVLPGFNEAVRNRML